MATDWMRKSCPPEHQVAVVSTDNSGKLVTAAAMTAQHQQQAVSRMCTTSSLITYDNDYNERRIPRDESPSEAQVFLSATPPVRKLRQPPVRMPSVVISDCSDEANTDPTELVVICNGDCPHPAGSCEDQLGRCVNNNHVNSDRNNPPVSPDLSSKSPSSAVQEMDPLDHQVIT